MLLGHQGGNAFPSMGTVHSYVDFMRGKEHGDLVHGQELTYQQQLHQQQLHQQSLGSLPYTY